MSPHPSPHWLDLKQLQRYALLASVATAVLLVIGGVLDPGQFFRSYLASYLLYVGIAAGSLVWIMIYHLTGGAWGYLIRHILEAATRTLPLLVVLFIPVALGLEYLYPWTDSQVVAADPHLRHKAVYLSVPFYLVRTAIYFACWIGIAYFLNDWSRKQDRLDQPGLARQARLLSAPGLAVYGLVITFAAVDWIMSLEPAWSSTIFSVLVAVGQILSAMAFAIIVLILLLDRPPLARVVSPESLNDLGNLLLTFVVLWTYMAFSQYLIIYAGNMREEIVWYLPRTQGGWHVVAVAIALFHFLVPFFLLLSRDVKRNPRLLASVAAGLLFMQLVQLHWQILPSFPDLGLLEQWMDFVAPVALGGIWLAYFIWQLERRPLLPRHDPNRVEAVHLHDQHHEPDATPPEVTPNG